MDDRAIRIGKISSIDYERGCADVYFDDEENLVRTELPFFTSEYLLPAVGESVVVAFSKGNRSHGYILGSFFNALHYPEHPGKGNYFKRFSDNAYIYYDAETETLEINAPNVIIRNMEKGG